MSKYMFAKLVREMPKWQREYFRRICSHPVRKHRPNKKSICQMCGTKFAKNSDRRREES